MWVLIFIVAAYTYKGVALTEVVQEFSSKEKCMVAQQILLQQAKERNTSVLNNTCAPK